jgi:hypothetical protein
MGIFLSPSHSGGSASFSRCREGSALAAECYYLAATAPTSDVRAFTSKIKRCAALFAVSPSSQSRRLRSAALFAVLPSLRCHGALFHPM